MSLKFHPITKYIQQLNKVVVAFSGGVDSTLLAYIAKEAIGKDNVMLVTLDISSMPADEIHSCKEIAAELGLPIKFIEVSELDIPNFAKNEHDRCYHCKKYLFSQIISYANSNSINNIIDGTNFDDNNDYRPGKKALNELKIISPFKGLKIGKADIRSMASEYGLSTSSKPSNACLATRVQYGEEITKDKLKRIELLENFLGSLGFTQYRVRNHNDLARIEFITSEMDKAWSIRAEISNKAKELGYLFCSIDCTGYKLGNMNSSLNQEILNKYK